MQYGFSKSIFKSLSGASHEKHYTHEGRAVVGPVSGKQHDKAHQILLLLPT
jgi:hypothetical protein